MKNKIVTVITFIIIILIWYVLSLRANPLFIPSPIDVRENMKILWSTGQLQIAIKWTFKRILIASCLSGIVAIPLGLLIYNFNIIFNKEHKPILELNGNIFNISSNGNCNNCRSWSGLHIQIINNILVNEFIVIIFCNKI